MRMLFQGAMHNQALFALWHEAGHAVVAHSMGARVLYYGLEPVPHCLVVPWGLSRHQRGVLLCAGGAMTKAIFGQEWGSDTDYRMAEALGDLNEYKSEAYEIAQNLLPQAKLLVEGRVEAINQSPLSFSAAADMTGVIGGNWVEDLASDHKDHAELSHLVEKAKMGRFVRWLVVKLAAMQIRYPRLAAKLSRM